MAKRIKDKELKGIEFYYDRIDQTFMIRTVYRKEDGTKKITGKVVMNKTYMFSTGIMIDQIKREQYLGKGIRNQIRSLKNKVEKLEGRIARLQSK